MNTTARPATRGAVAVGCGLPHRSVVRPGAPYIFVLVWCLAGCGGSKTEEVSTSADVGVVEAVPVETELHRAALDELLSRGPAYVLAMVQIDSSMKDGKFVGFEIISFRTELPAYLDLRPGDVVTRINDLPIERPEQFFEVFEKLKTASEVKLDIRRDGAPKTIVVPIVP